MTLGASSDFSSFFSASSRKASSKVLISGVESAFFVSSRANVSLLIPWSIFSNFKPFSSHEAVLDEIEWSARFTSAKILSSVLYFRFVIWQKTTAMVLDIVLCWTLVNMLRCLKKALKCPNIWTKIIFCPVLIHNFSIPIYTTTGKA